MAITQTRKDQAKGRRILGCFFTFFVLFGLGMSTVFLLPVVQTFQANGWRRVPCTIVTSQVETHSSSNGSPTYSVAVTYRYTVDDSNYVGTRYKFMSGSSSGYDGKRAIVDRLSPAPRRSAT